MDKRTLMRSLLPALVMCLTGPVVAQQAQQAVMLMAADGVRIHAQYWPAAGTKAPLILAFHQAGSSSAEYAPLAPRLVRAGFSVLAIDQRSGGGEFGGKNSTVAALGRSASYDAALPDLEAALVWGRTRANGAPVLVWGSSYSAALVFVLAAKHPADIQGLLAFSPGEYLGRGNAVNQAARSLTLPIFISQASSEDEIEQSKIILEAVRSRDKTLFEPTGRGIHGSATLRADRNAAGAEENWAAVLGFLGKFKPKD